MEEHSLQLPTKEDNGPKKIGKTFLIVFLVLILSPFILVYLFLSLLLVDIPLRVNFLMAARSQKRSIIFVYSASPIWQTYLENNVLPRVSGHAILLNWSDRNQWNRWHWTVRAFHHWGGQRDFNPLAIVFCNFFKIQTVRFYRPFLDYKHGKEQALHQAETKLFGLLNVIDRKQQGKI